MGRTCTVCGHEERHEIERELVNRASSYRGIASQYGVTQAAIGRHVRGGHIAALLAKAHRAEEMERADELLMDVRRLQARTLRILRRAEDARDPRTALSAVSQARQNIVLLAEMRGELDRRTFVNIAVNPQWIELRGLIVEALHRHPEALVDVRLALERGENGRD